MDRLNDKGLTLVEMLVVIAIVSILAAAVMPLSRMTVKRAKEAELRGALRTVRTAIDAFNRDCETKKLSTIEGYCKVDQYNFPESLEKLTEPLKMAGAVDKSRRYLRRIPRDPMTPATSQDGSHNWGLRSYTDPADSTQWGGSNVYDIYSKSEGIGLDGTKYNTW
jgi:general secretion pathway protein G